MDEAKNIFNSIFTENESKALKAFLEISKTNKNSKIKETNRNGNENSIFKSKKRVIIRRGGRTLDNKGMVP